MKTTMFFEYMGQWKRIEFSKVVCFHGQISKQAELSEILVDGLNGMDKKFQLDNLTVKKKTLNVIDFSNGLISDDLKMTSKSFNLKILKEIIEKYEAKDLLTEQLSEKMVEIQNLIINRYKSLSEEYPQLIKPSIEIKNIDDLILSQFSLVDKGDLNNAISKELQISLILDYVQEHQDETYYLLLNQINESLDLSELLFVLDKILATENLVCLIFTNSSQLYYHTSTLIDHYFLLDDCIKKELITKDFHLETLSFSNLLSVEEVDRITSLKKMVSLMENYENLVGEHKNFVSYFFEKHNINDV